MAQLLHSATSPRPVSGATLPTGVLVHPTPLWGLPVTRTVKDDPTFPGIPLTPALGSASGPPECTLRHTSPSLQGHTSNTHSLFSLERGGALLLASNNTLQTLFPTLLHGSNNTYCRFYQGMRCSSTILATPPIVVHSEPCSRGFKEGKGSPSRGGEGIASL